MDGAGGGGGGSDRLVSTIISTVHDSDSDTNDSDTNDSDTNDSDTNDSDTNGSDTNDSDTKGSPDDPDDSPDDINESPDAVTNDSAAIVDRGSGSFILLWGALNRSESTAPTRMPSCPGLCITVVHWAAIFINFPTL